MTARRPMARFELVFRVHAIQRMFQRGISMDEVRQVVENGETIGSYPDDTPNPSRLILGRDNSRVLHVVAADDEKAAQTFLMSLYEPSPTLWNQEFRRRQKP